VSGKKLLAMDGGSGKVVGIGHASVAGCRSGTVRDWPKPRCFVIPGRSDAKRSADPGIHAVTSELRTRCRTPSRHVGWPSFCAAAFFGESHGMDSRVSATSLRSCFALE